MTSMPPNGVGGAGQLGLFQLPPHPVGPTERTALAWLAGLEHGVDPFGAELLRCAAATVDQAILAGSRYAPQAVREARALWNAIREETAKGDDFAGDLAALLAPEGGHAPPP